MNYAFSRQPFIWLAITIAVLVGIFLTNIFDPINVGILLSVVGCLSLPLLIKCYHPLLIVSWNAMITPYFLPGAPHLWMIFAYLGFIVALVLRVVYPERKFPTTGGVSTAILVFAILLVATGLTGGLGGRIFGSEVYGLKKYFAIGAAIAGFFALISRPISITKARLAIWAFFLPGLTALLSNLAFLAGEKFYFLYWVFPPFYALYQLPEFVPGTFGISRLGGGLVASYCLASAVIVLYGLRGILDITKPWRLMLLVAAILLGLLSGFRIALAYIGMALFFAFFMERLYKTIWLPIILGVSAATALLVLPNADKLPLPMQRALSFLPIRIDPVAKYDAEASLWWRVTMWQELWPEVKKQFWWGRGFTIDARAWNLATEGQRRGFVRPYELALISGDYHNGFLGIIIPLGIWGIIVFLWFLIASLALLYEYYRSSPPELLTINRGLFVLFLVNAVVYFAFFGALDLDLQKFTGIVGLSVALNSKIIPRQSNDRSIGLAHGVNH